MTSRLLTALVYGKPLIYLDNTATSQTPSCVVEAIEHAYYHTKANVHRGVHALSGDDSASGESARARTRIYQCLPYL